MKRLYFVRHGLSVMNKQGLWSGQIETPLAEEGRKQAADAGVAAKELAIEHVVSSPFSRAYDTAKIIAEVIDYPTERIQLNQLLIERGLGTLEGQPWNPSINIDDTDGIETLDMLFERVRRAFEFLQTIPADNVLVVSHGATGRALRHVISPELPFGGLDAEPFPNGKIVRLI